MGAELSEALSEIDQMRSETVQIGRNALMASWHSQPYSQVLTDARTRLWRSTSTLRDIPRGHTRAILGEMRVVLAEIHGVVDALQAGPDPKPSWWRRLMRRIADGVKS